MKTKNKIFSLLVLPSWFTLSAYDTELPDTFHIKTADIVFYEDISSMRGFIRDSIDNPKAYLIDNQGVFGDLKFGHRGMIIAIKQDDKYIIFPIVEEQWCCYFHECEFERKNINMTGNEELIIRCRYRLPRSSLDLSQWLKILVWDIDAYKCLLDFEYGSIFSRATYNRENPYEKPSCNLYNVELEEMRLTIQKEEGCSRKVSGEKYVYRLTEFGFVLDRKFKKKTRLRNL